MEFEYKKNIQKKYNDYNYCKYEDDSYFESDGTMIMEFFNNNKNIIYLSGISYLSGEPYEPLNMMIIIYQFMNRINVMRFLIHLFIMLI